MVAAIMPAPTPPWHALPASRVLAEVDSAATGLTPELASARLAEHGPNRLPEPPRRGPLLRFLLHFHNILIYVLLVAAVVTALLGHVIDTVVILAVVLVNAIIGFVQEGRAEQAMAAIRHMLAPRASVIRAGQRREVPGEELVVGDLVLLDAGDKVPADLRLLEVHGLQVQEAILTGESVPVAKRSDPVAEEAALGDRCGMGFSGTLVTSGSARGVVVATGAATQIGRISGLLADVEQLSTPLVEQMARFARWLTALILVIAAVLLGYGYFVVHYEFAEMFMAVVGLSVAAIPEGLPAVLTITLAVGVQTMAKRNAIVRRLPAIETLGSVSVICSDKTGTLTRNEMLATRVALADTTLEVRGEGYRPSGEVEGHEALPDHSPLHELARTLRLCNDAALHEDQGTWTAVGDPMEAALLALAAKLGHGLGPEQVTEGWVRRDAIPFDAKHRYMATLDAPPEGPAQIHIKGAPEQILSMCTHVRGADGSDAPLDREAWLERVHELASAGQRVLAIASKPARAEQDSLASADVEQGACLLALVGLIDPPRPEAITAVAECHSAGIRVKMITGDHARTALAIGRQIGLQNAERVLTGADIDGLADADLEHEVLDTDVFARTSPEHKLRLVMALQANGLTVAMTGDGVNDAPALKRADAGVAMGRSGSEAAKEAAELVLADDNFASIAAAVREGRTVYDNIRKVVTWTLPTNAGEALTVIVALLAGWSLPITPVQILWVNLITAVTLGLALAFEPTEDNTMARPPRPRGEALLDGSLVWHVVFVSLLFLAGVFGMFTYGVDRGYPLELSRTLALNTLVALEIFHLFFVRNIYGTSLTWKLVRGTPMVWMTVGGVTLAQFVITYLPAAQTVFATAPVRFLDGLLIVGVGVALLIVLEIEKQLRLTLRGR
jgi:magnesium-transporting ATPase (P-type)